jgi:hypothetical protein
MGSVIFNPGNSEITSQMSIIDALKATYSEQYRMVAGLK